MFFPEIFVWLAQSHGASLASLATCGLSAAMLCFALITQDQVFQVVNVVVIVMGGLFAKRVYKTEKQLLLDKEETTWEVRFRNLERVRESEIAEHAIQLAHFDEQITVLKERLAEAIQARHRLENGIASGEFDVLKKEAPADEPA